MHRVLGSVRLSRLTDESTSPERQRDRIQWWAGGQGARVVAIAEDLDVSGARDPFERDGLGEWLTDERADEWDVLVAWKLDRISRSAEDTFKLLKWCEARGKRIVCVDDGVDSSTQMGKVWIQLAGIFAEVERTNIKERALASRAKLRTSGRWHGETVPYGYMPEELPEGGWRLVVDPVAKIVVERIVGEVLDGRAIQAIADGLTHDGILTPRDQYRANRGKSTKGAAWNVQTLFKLIASRSWLGEVTHKGHVVRDENYEPFYKAEPIIGHDTWNRLQAALATRRLSRNVRTNKVSPLMGVILCLECESNMHHRRNQVGGKEYRYYYCPDDHGQSVKAPEFEGFFGEAFVKLVGGVEVMRKKYVPAVDHTRELEAAQDAVTELTAAMADASSKTVRDAILAQLAGLDRRITELEKLPASPARYDFVPTGKTYRELWESGDTDSRRQLLLNSGIRVLVKVEGRGRSKGANGTQQIQVRIPANITDRINTPTDADWRSESDPTFVHFNSTTID